MIGDRKWYEREMTKIALDHLAGLYSIAEGWRADAVNTFKSQVCKRAAMQQALLIKTRAIVAHDRILTGRAITGGKRKSALEADALKL